MQFSLWSPPTYSPRHNPNHCWHYPAFLSFYVTCFSESPVSQLTSFFQLALSSVSSGIISYTIFFPPCCVWISRLIHWRYCQVFVSLAKSFTHSTSHYYKFSVSFPTWWMHSKINLFAYDFSMPNAWNYMLYLPQRTLSSFPSHSTARKDQASLFHNN